MKRTLIIFISLFAACVNIKLSAQEYRLDVDMEEYETERQGILDKISIGADMGFSIPSMIYTSHQYDIYKKSPLFSGLGGLFVDWNFYGDWSIKPYMGFVGRGVHMKFAPQYIDYRLYATYFDIRIPIVYNFNTWSDFDPYVALGPSLNFAAGGTILYTSGSQNFDFYAMKLNKGNFKPVDIGVFFGIGFNYPVKIHKFKFKVGAEIGYNLGLVDTFSKKEKNNESVAVNLPIYSVQGSRLNHNLSLTASISIPLRSIFGKKQKRTEKQIYVNTTYVEPAAQERKTMSQEKQCCSLDEMYEMILAGEDISTKKVCASDDITFDFDKATIRPESFEYLDKFVTVLMKFPSIKVTISGHTDNIGNDQYNLQLSRQRAEAVEDYFINCGIDPDRLSSYGYGSHRPLTDNSSAAARAMNRRVEFDIDDSSLER